jgi:hypothetical protein
LALAKHIPATDWQTAIFQQLAKLMEIDDNPKLHGMSGARLLPHTRQR